MQTALPSFETLHCEEVAAHVLMVTLNRPQVGNAINTQMGCELREVFVPLKFTPGDLRCIVLTGAGDLARQIRIPPHVIDVERDTERDYYLSATESQEYGLIDKVIDKRG